MKNHSLLALTYNTNSGINNLGIGDTVLGLGHAGG